MADMNEFLDILHRLRKSPSINNFKVLQSRIEKFSHESTKDRRTIYIGTLDKVHYGILIERISAVSMNGVSDNCKERALPNTRHVHRYLNTHSVVGYPPDLVSERDVIVLGRMRASHHPQHPHFQSHWIIVMDNTKCLWALYPDKIDEQESLAVECKKQGCGECDDYDPAWDSVFGASPDQKAVPLGSIKDLPMRLGKEFPHVPQVYSLQWYTRLNHTKSMPVIKKDINPNSYPDIQI